jgi:olefin beta-lactone synthetase
MQTLDTAIPSSANNVISYLAAHARLRHDKPALLWLAPSAASPDEPASLPAHQSITFGTLADRVSCIAGHLRSLGIAPGDRVIIFLPMSMELYAAMFSVLQVGAVAVFLDSWARRDHLGICAERIRPKAMVSFETAFKFCRVYPALARIPINIVAGSHREKYTADLSRLMASGGQNPIEPVTADAAALITFTTGSSGTPKGAVRTHRFLTAQHRALDRCIPYAETDVDLPTFPIFSLNNIAAGVTTILPAINQRSPSAGDAQILAAQITAGAATCCTFSPSLFTGVAAYCTRTGIELSGLRRVVTGGAPVGATAISRFKAIAPGATIAILYGSTEVEPIAHIEAGELLTATTEGEGVNVGRISAELDYKFIRIQRECLELGNRGWEEWEVSAGEIGELIVSGAHVCGEYFNDPAAFRRSKIKEPTGKIWHRTGDLGMLDLDGNLWLSGRVHNAFRRAGRYLFPVRAELIMQELDFVRQAALLGLPDSELGNKACAVISLREGLAGASREGYRRVVRALLADRGIPVDEVIIMDAIPMDPRHHSKVEYASLRALICDGHPN